MRFDQAPTRRHPASHSRSQSSGSAPVATSLGRGAGFGGGGSFAGFVAITGFDGDVRNLHVTVPEHLDLVARLARPAWEASDR